MKIVLALLGLALAMPAVAQPRDGSRDFDDELGRWTIQTRRLLRPLTGSSDWVTYAGEKVVTPVLGGRGNVAEVTESGATGRLHFMALRLYDPAAEQWGLYFTSAGGGSFSTPLHGRWRDGALEFVGPDTLRGRNILVRFVMRAVDADHARSEQAFSEDGGRTWEVNWINEYTRARS